MPELYEVLCKLMSYLYSLEEDGEFRKNILQ